MIQVPAEGPVAGRDDGPTDLDSLLGLRSVKRSFFDQYRAAESRLRRSMHALDRVSGALVRTADGPEELMRSVLRVAYDQLDAQWALVALRDGQVSLDEASAGLSRAALDAVFGVGPAGAPGPARTAAHAH